MCCGERENSNGGEEWADVAGLFATGAVMMSDSELLQMAMSGSLILQWPGSVFTSMAHVAQTTRMRSVWPAICGHVDV